MRESASQCLRDLTQTPLLATQRDNRPNVACELFLAFQHPNLAGSDILLLLCVGCSEVGAGSHFRRIYANLDFFVFSFR